MGLSKFKIKYREFVDILRHEYHYIFHDGGVLLVVVGAILIYSTAYSFAYKNEVLRDIPIAIVDNSQTPSSRQIIRSFDATPNLRVAYKPTSLEEAKKLFYQRKVNGVIVIPSDYEKKLQRAEKVNLAIYADASYFLMYRQVFFDVTNSVLHSNGNVEWVRFVSKGAQPKQAEALSNPVTISVKNLYNPSGGYATFIMPAIIMVIIQQTLLIGIGMIGGTWREFGLYRKLCPPDRKRMSTLPIVLGKATVYGLIYGVTTFYILGLHYRLFHYPMNGATSTVVVFMLAYLAACIFLGIAISTLFRYRENSLLLLLWTSIPLLMLSGVSYPREGIPDWLFNFGQLFPSSHGVDGFIRIQSMGASLSEVLPEIRMLCILTLIYGGLACIGIHQVIARAAKDTPVKNQNR